MNITLLCTGKTEDAYLREGIGIYRKRIAHYLPFELIELSLSKKWSALPPSLIREKEGELILKHMKKSDFSVLLDEKGKSLDSMSFSAFLQQKMNRSVKNLLFVVGGAWGFSEEVHSAANTKISLSPMTFSHQMVRLFFVEQLYRAMTIWRNESYHNA
jgi:23S rRNA (pseudouridine1915-N3)-methyltransferase